MLLGKSSNLMLKEVLEAPLVYMNSEMLVNEIGSQIVNRERTRAMSSFSYVDLTNKAIDIGLL